MNNAIKSGQSVGIADILSDVDELKKLAPSCKIKNRYLAARKGGVRGIFLKFAENSRGRVYLVRHNESQDIGAYQLSEICYW